MFTPQAAPSRVELSNFFLLFIWREVRRRVRSPSPTSSSFVRWDRSVEGLSKCLVPTTRLAATCFMVSPGTRRGREVSRAINVFIMIYIQNHTTVVIMIPLAQISFTVYKLPKTWLFDIHRSR